MGARQGESSNGRGSLCIPVHALFALFGSAAELRGNLEIKRATGDVPVPGVCRLGDATQPS